MLIQRPSDIPGSEITARTLFEQRRRLIAASGLMLGAGSLLWRGMPAAHATTVQLNAQPSPFSTAEALTDRAAVTGYNNYYEFGTGKEDPALNAHKLQTEPWTLRVEGLVGKPRSFDIDQLRRLAPLEERIYRMRCVEGWSMVIPWIGLPLAALLKEVEPQGSARFVQFLTHYDPEIMTQRRFLHWPYAEGLRLDEAQHPLTLLAVGLYGEVLPKQNGAPVRLVVPWKYGFKSAKSITTIRLVENKPPTAWNRAAPHEYGFYSNVNPDVAHPRWSQASERRIGEMRKRPTLMFNGYAEEVAQLYQGMDLSKDF